VVAHHGDPPGGRSPDREGDARDAIDRADMGAELVVGSVIVALAEQERSSSETVGRKRYGSSTSRRTPSG